jgi:hypothetical protein
MTSETKLRTSRREMANRRKITMRKSGNWIKQRLRKIPSRSQNCSWISEYQNLINRLIKLPKLWDLKKKAKMISIELRLSCRSRSSNMRKISIARFKRFRSSTPCWMNDYRKPNLVRNSQHSWRRPKLMLKGNMNWQKITKTKY